MEHQDKQQRKLTTKQELFVIFYLGEAKGNAREAARQAGYKNAEISSKSNMRNPLILERIKDFVDKKFASAEEVLAELTDVGMAEWRDFITVLEYDEDGKPLRVKMDLGAKVKSLELLGKYHALFTEKLEHSGGVDIQIVGIDVEAL